MRQGQRRIGEGENRGMGDIRIYMIVAGESPHRPVTPSPSRRKGEREIS